MVTRPFSRPATTSEAEGPVVPVLQSAAHLPDLSDSAVGLRAGSLGETSAMLILIPILVPPAMALGIDPTQFGVIVVLNLMIGTITPPVGIVLFITARVADLSFDKVCKATWPFLWPLFAVLAAITVFPVLTTGLPALFR